MNKTLEKLIELIESSDVYKIEKYDYFVFPFKGIFPFDASLLEDISELLKKDMAEGDYKIFTFMTDGIMGALPLAISLKKPLVVARDFHYNIPDVAHFVQKTKYYERDMYFSGIGDSDNVEIVDCMVSSGGSVLNAIDKLEEIGCNILGVHSIIDKVDYGGSQKIRKRGYNFTSLLDVTIKDGKVYCSPSEKYE